MNKLLSVNKRTAHLYAPHFFAYSVGDETYLSVEDILKKTRVPGCQFAVLSPDGITQNCYGSVKSGGGPVTDTTRFNAASLSKFFTIMLVAKLAEKHPALDLFNVEIKGVPLRDYLTHQAGISDWSSNDIDQHPISHTDPSTPLPRLSEVIEREEVNPTPKSERSYSNLGYAIVEEFLEDHFDQSFAKLAQTHLFTELGMEDSTFEQTTVSSGKACGHGWKGKQTGEETHRFPSVAPGGVWTTASDLAKLLRAIAKLPPKPLQIFKDECDNNLTLVHDGRNPGYYGTLFYDIKNGSGYVILTNSGYGNVACGCLRRAEPVKSFTKKSETPPQSLAGYYRRAEESYFHVSHQHNQLTAQVILGKEHRAVFELTYVESPLDHQNEHWFVANNPPYPLLPCQIIFYRRYIEVVTMRGDSDSHSKVAENLTPYNPLTSPTTESKTTYG